MEDLEDKTPSDINIKDKDMHDCDDDESGDENVKV